jgi:hypothetical protein
MEHRPMSFRRQDKVSPSPRPRLTEQWKDCADLIRCLVREDKDYIVFIDDDLQLHWETTTEFDARMASEKTKEKADIVLAKAAVLEFSPYEGLSPEMKVHFKALVGEAIAYAFDGSSSAAENMLADAKQYWIARSQEASRFWYLSASLVVAALFFFAALAFWLDKTAQLASFGSLYWIIMAAFAGTTGALLSVISRTGKLPFDNSSGRALHYLEAISRIVVGGISGGLIGLAIQTKLLVLFPASEHQHAVMGFAAFVAGAGERLAPSIISAIDKKGSDAADKIGSAKS